jgi:FkbH-like protein
LCARFYNGILRNAQFRGLLDYGAEIRFKRWGKLEAPLQRGMVTRDGYLHAARRDARLQKWFQPLDSFLAPLLTGRRTAVIRNWLRSKSLDETVASCADALSAPSALLLEAFNPGATTIRLNLEVVQQDAVRFREVLSFAPGLSSHQVPFAKLQLDLTRFTSTDRISLYPENDAEARLVFTWLHLVAFAQQQPTRSAPSAPKVKVVVWDLDNTVWSGILAEDGADGVQLRPGVAETVATLDARGIVQSIASKNNHAPAWVTLERFGLAKYFLYPKINWQPKSLNLKAIANEFNLGVDSFAFIDDSPSERAEVQAELPQVRVFAQDVVSRLPGLPEFDVPVTEESRRRREMYATEAARKQVAHEFGDDADAFLRSCELQVELFAPNTDAEQLRCFELLQRTNQLNISGRRYSEDEFRRLTAAPHWIVVAISCADRFGGYGLVGCFTARAAAGGALLEDFVLSCRVASKRVEQATFARLAAELDRLGHARLFANFQSTKRNGLMHETLTAIGFVASPQPSPGTLVLATRHPVPAANIVTVRRCEVQFSRLAG